MEACAFERTSALYECERDIEYVRAFSLEIIVVGLLPQVENKQSENKRAAPYVSIFVYDHLMRKLWMHVLADWTHD